MITMLRLLPILAVIFQLPSISASFNCSRCDFPLIFLSNDSINTNSCVPTPNQFPICKGQLVISSTSNQANVTFNGELKDFTRVAKGANIIKQEIIFTLPNNGYYRTLEIFCSKDDSCSNEIKKIYDKIKVFNHMDIQNKLKNQLSNISLDTTNLTCANNANQEIPCPNGCCEVTSNGNGGFDRRCIDPPCNSDPRVDIEQYVIGEPNTESYFTYRCNTPMCNSKTNAEKVRGILKDSSLLTPTGVSSGPPNTAQSIFSQTSIIIQCILIISITKFF